MGTNTRAVTLDQLHVDVLPPETQGAFRLAVTLPFLGNPWYLAGGTALALLVGHRSSEDLDFFTEEKDFDVAIMERDLMNAGAWNTTRAQTGTLYGELNGAKISLIAYPSFRPSGDYRACGTIRILPPEDIASMKIMAISQRGRKRDFVDLYWLITAQGMPLPAIITHALEQFPGKKVSLPHVLKSLAYFEDAEDDPMPELHFKTNWKEIRRYFEATVPPIAKELLGLNQ